MLVDGGNPRLTRAGASAFGQSRFRLLGVVFGTMNRQAKEIINVPVEGDIEDALHIAFYWKATELQKLVPQKIGSCDGAICRNEH